MTAPCPRPFPPDEPTAFVCTADRPLIALDPTHWSFVDQALERAGYQIARLPRDRAEHGAFEAAAPAVGLITRSGYRVDVAMLDRLPNLRVAATSSAGHDHFDLLAFAARGIVGFDTRGANADAAADLTLGLILSVAREIPWADRQLEIGFWERGKLIARGIELRGRTLGIIGIGHVGREVARRALAFGLAVLALDPYVAEADLPADLADRVELVGTLDELCERAEILTLHTPLDASTRGMFDRARIESLRWGTILINVARGGIVDDRALAKALRDGRLLGAGLDVYAEEPPSADHIAREGRTLEPNRLVTTPHIGGGTSATQRRMGLLAVDRLRGYLERGDTQHAVHTRPSGEPDQTGGGG